jgi:hypothetical protein
MTRGKRIIKKPNGESTQLFFTNARSMQTDVRHILEDIIFITIAAVICGAETWNEIEAYGESK